MFYKTYIKKLNFLLTSEKFNRDIYFILVHECLIGILMIITFKREQVLL